MLVELEGEDRGHAFVARMRYHRTWTLDNGGWRVLTATGSVAG